MKKIILILFLLSFKVLLAQESVDPKSTLDLDIEKKRLEYPINGRYKSGQNLIYDCFGKYFACVNEDSFLACKDKRSEKVKLDEPTYRCAPLKKFTKKAECLIENYSVIEMNAAIRFCYPK